jgi:hypothetical protein
MNKSAYQSDARWSNNVEQSAHLKTLALMGIPVPLPEASDTSDKIGVTVIKRQGKGLFRVQQADESLRAFETRKSEARGLRAAAQRARRVALKQDMIDRVSGGMVQDTDSGKLVYRPGLMQAHSIDREEAVYRAIPAKAINVRVNRLTGETETRINRTMASIVDSLMTRNWRGGSSAQGRVRVPLVSRAIKYAEIYESMLPSERSKADLFLMTVSQFKGGISEDNRIFGDSTFLAVDRAINVFTRQKDGSFWIEDTAELHTRDIDGMVNDSYVGRGRFQRTIEGEWAPYRVEQRYTMAPHAISRCYVNPQLLAPLGRMKPASAVCLRSQASLWRTFTADDGAMYTPVAFRAIA